MNKSCFAVITLCDDLSPTSYHEHLLLHLCFFQQNEQRSRPQISIVELRQYIVVSDLRVSVALTIDTQVLSLPIPTQGTRELLSLKILAIGLVNK